MAYFGGYTGQRGGTGGQSDWDYRNWAAHAQRNWGQRSPAAASPQQTGFMGQMYGRTQDWQDPWRSAAVTEPRSAGYAQRSTGIQPETAWAKWVRERGDPRMGGTGALGASGLTGGQITQMGGGQQWDRYNEQLANYNRWKTMSAKYAAQATSQRDYDDWLARNPNPGKPNTPITDWQGGAGATGAGGAAPQFGAPPTPEALAMRDELDVIPRWLQDQYGDIATYGQLGSQGMRDIDQPMFRQEEAVLGSIDPFMAQQTGLYQGQTREQLQQIRDQAADRRRRATRAAGTSLGRTIGQRPGLATQMMAEAAAPVTAAQAGLEFEAGQRGTQQELGLGAGAYDLATQILMGRGDRRTQLELQNQLSKAGVGLPGVAGASQYMADLWSNRYYDPTHPLQNQYSYQTGLMGVGQGMDLQKMALQQQYQSMNAQQQFDFQKQLMQFKNSLGADDESWAKFMSFLDIGSTIAGNINWGGGGEEEPEPPV